MAGSVRVLTFIMVPVIGTICVDASSPASGEGYGGKGPGWMVFPLTLSGEPTTLAAVVEFGQNRAYGELVVLDAHGVELAGAAALHLPSNSGYQIQVETPAGFVETGEVEDDPFEFHSVMIGLDIASADGFYFVLIRAAGNVGAWEFDTDLGPNEILGPPTLGTRSYFFINADFAAEAGVEAVSGLGGVGVAHDATVDLIIEHELYGSFGAGPTNRAEVLLPSGLVEECSCYWGSPNLGAPGPYQFRLDGASAYVAGQGYSKAIVADIPLSRILALG